MAIIAGFPQRLLGLHNETYLPTFQDSQGTYPWLSGSHEDPWWSRCHQRPACQGPQAPGCLNCSGRPRDHGSVHGPCHCVYRLKTRNQFQAVLAGNKLVSGTRFAVHHLAVDTPSFKLAIGLPAPTEIRSSKPCTQLWLGAMIPKRWAKRAVTRNAIKRQIYSVARDFESRLPSGAWVVRLRSGFDRSQFRSASSIVLKDVVRSELVVLLTRIAHAASSKSLQGLAK